MKNRVEIAEFVENLSNVTAQRNFVNDSIQIAMDRMFQFHDWPYYLQEGAIETVDDSSTSTVIVTQGSKTVTAAAAAFSAAMVGRKFRIEGNSVYYRIASFTDTTNIELEQNYQGGDESGVSYEIYQDEYRLAADVDKYKLIRQLENSAIVWSTSPTNFDQIFPTPQTLADPRIEVMSGTKLDSYLTGTISGTGGTSVITGSSTVWASVEGLGRMSLVKIGSSVYTVKSVDSDTQLTVYESIATIASGTSYEIPLRNIVIQVYPLPDAQRLLYYRYFRKPAPLAQDSDIPDTPAGETWRRILAYGALAEVLAHKGDVNKLTLYEQKFTAGITDLKLKYGSFAPDRIYRRKSADRIRRVPFGREEATFDRRFSL